MLFLDELAEFPISVLDNLRQSLEEGRIIVCRASAVVAFPARFETRSPALSPSLNLPVPIRGTPVSGRASARRRRRPSSPSRDRHGGPGEGETGGAGRERQETGRPRPEPRRAGEGR